MKNDPLEDIALRKLITTLGPVRGAVVISEVLAEIGLRELQTPTDRMHFANALMKRSGLLEAIGRAIKIQAILHGAREETSISSTQPAVRKEIKIA